MTKQPKISQDFIQEKYIQLLEESYVSFQDKPKFKNLKLLFISLFLIATTSVIVFYTLKPNQNSFAENLEKTTYNTHENLIKYQNTFYKLPNNTKSWKTKNGLSFNFTKNNLVLKSENSAISTPIFTIYSSKNDIFAILLPDGSHITLNKSAKVSCNLDKQNNKPNITLQGEAFFKIAKQKGKLFKINATKMNIEVVGTEFNITNYKDKNTQLSLVEGIVKIKTNQQQQLIHAGQEATYNNKTLHIENKDFFDSLAWLQTSIHFNNQPLNQITKIIENWYNVKINFKNTKLKALKFTGTLHKNNGLTHFLQTLKYTKNVQATINKNTITLNKNPLN